MTVEERINELQKQIDELKAEIKNGNGVFKRVDTGKEYYTLQIESGELKPFHTTEEYEHFDDCRFDNNNYFYTEERAKEVAEKINALLKLERIYDTLCPEYKPNWCNSNEFKWFITNNYSENDANYDARAINAYYKIPTITYFPEDKIEEAIKLYEKMT